MKTILKIIPFFVLIVSCSKPIADEQLKYLNGYWEIKEVKAPDEQPKEYTANTVVDYFEIANRKGFRQKVSPQLNGSYQTNTVQETVEVVDSVGKTFIKYHTTYAKWVEELVELEENKMTVINENSIKYYYERFQPIILE